MAVSTDLVKNSTNCCIQSHTRILTQFLLIIINIASSLANSTHLNFPNHNHHHHHSHLHYSHLPLLSHRLLPPYFPQPLPPHPFHYQVNRWKSGGNIENLKRKVSQNRRFKRGLRDGKKIQIANLHSLQRHLNNTTFHSYSHRPNISSQHEDKKIIITTILDPPFMMLKQEGHYITGNQRFEGFLVDLLKHLASNLAFDYEIRLARDSKYGDLYMGKYWDGAIGEVHREEADVAVGSLVINNITGHFVDFTDSFLSLRYSALLSKPKKKRKKGGKPPNSTPSANQTRGDDEDIIIKDAKQLVESGINVGVVRDSLAQKLLSHSSLPEHRVLFSRLAQSWPSAFARNRHEGIARTRAEKYAFIIDTPIAEYEAGRQPCDVYTTEPFLELVQYGIVLRRGMMLERKGVDGGVVKVALKELFDEEMRKMKGGDEMQAMYLKWWKDECVEKVSGGGGGGGEDGFEGHKIGLGLYQHDHHVSFEQNGAFNQHSHSYNNNNLNNNNPNKKNPYNYNPNNHNLNNNNPNNHNLNNNNPNNNNPNNYNPNNHNLNNNNLNNNNPNNHNLNNHNLNNHNLNNHKYSIYKVRNPNSNNFKTKVYFPSSSSSSSSFPSSSSSSPSFFSSLFFPHSSSSHPSPSIHLITFLFLFISRRQFNQHLLFYYIF